MKIDRLIGILSILLQKDRVTAPELARIFEVSRRTISRDIDALGRAGIPIQTVQGKGGGIAIMAGYKVDKTLLTSREMQGILSGLRSLDSVSGTKFYARLMEKLAPGNDGILPGDPHILIDLASWYKASLSEKIEKIHSAIEGRQLIRFQYAAPAGESRREAEPYFLIFQWSSWYVWAWCQNKKDFRLFKLNRMTDLTVSGSFSPRPVQAPDLSAQRVFPGRYLVRARVDAQYKWRLLEEYGPDSFSLTPEGDCLFAFHFSDPDQILSWILSFQGAAELLEPQELRAQLARIGENITAAHQT